MSDNNIVPFNPLDKRNLGESVGLAILRQEVIPLSELKPFLGSGVYALYYIGDFEPYKLMSNINRTEVFSIPIYVGKAVPSGARKGGDLDTMPENKLYNRLSQHSKSIQEAVNLDLKDFYCRFLVVDDIWIPLGESLLIAKYSPLWNKIVDGFGNHNPGKGRHLGMRPRWDVLHPGRSWADKCTPREESSSQIKKEIEDYLQNIL